MVPRYISYDEDTVKLLGDDMLKNTAEIVKRECDADTDRKNKQARNQDPQDTRRDNKELSQEVYCAIRDASSDPTKFHGFCLQQGFREDSTDSDSDISGFSTRELTTWMKRLDGDDGAPQLVEVSQQLVNKVSKLVHQFHRRWGLVTDAKGGQGQRRFLCDDLQEEKRG